MTNPDNARQVQAIVASMAQMTGRRYPNLEQELSRLTVPALLDLARFLADQRTEIQRVKNQAITQPWRR